MAEMLRIEDVYKTFNAGTINEKRHYAVLI